MLKFISERKIFYPFHFQDRKKRGPFEKIDVSLNVMVEVRAEVMFGQLEKNPTTVVLDISTAYIFPDFLLFLYIYATL